MASKIHKFTYSEPTAFRLPIGCMLLPQKNLELAKEYISKTYSANELPLDGSSVGRPYLIDGGIVRITEETESMDRLTIKIELFHESLRRLRNLADLLELPYVL